MYSGNPLTYGQVVWNTLKEHDLVDSTVNSFSLCSSQASHMPVPPGTWPSDEEMRLVPINVKYQ